MAARRLTALNCRESLHEILARGGSLEFAVDPSRQRHDNPRPDEHSDTDAITEALHLMWRVKLRAILDDSIIVDHFMAHGRAITVAPGVKLRGSLSIGQNRWLFCSEILGSAVDGLILRFPDNLTRWPRRASRRYSATGIALPPIKCWPLSDPLTAIPAEAACARRLERLAQDATPANNHVDTAPDADHPDSLLWPETGPGVTATLLNIGGGGFGASIPSEEGGRLRSGMLHFVRLNLTPLLTVPIDLTARLAYTHASSDGSVRAGFAFEFGLNPAHRDVVLSALSRCMNRLTAEPDPRPHPLTATPNKPGVEAA